MRKIIASIALLLVLSVYSSGQSKNNWMSGAWHGTGREVADGSTWTMRLAAGHGKYEIKYPSLRCGGEWRLIRFRSRRASFAERIRYGASRCEPSGKVVITRLKGNRIKFSYYYNGSKKIASYATLYRRRR